MGCDSIITKKLALFLQQNVIKMWDKHRKITFVDSHAEILHSVWSYVSAHISSLAVRERYAWMALWKVCLNSWIISTWVTTYFTNKIVTKLKIHNNIRNRGNISRWKSNKNYFRKVDITTKLSNWYGCVHSMYLYIGIFLRFSFFSVFIELIERVFVCCLAIRHQWLMPCGMHRSIWIIFGRNSLSI